MNYKMEQLRYDEIELSFSRIIKECKKNIKWIVISAVVCALVLPVLAYLVDSKDYKEVAQIMNGEVEYDFTEEEKYEIDNYIFFIEEKRQLKLYGETSPLLQLDYNDVHIGKVKFYVEAEDDKLDMITSAYINLMTIENIVEEFEKKTNDIDVSYLGQMVSVVGSEGFLTIEVKAKNEELSVEYLNILKEMLLAQSEFINDTICQHQIKVLQEKKWSDYSSEVFYAQKNHFQSLKDIDTNIKNLENSLSNLQKAYIVNQIEDNDELLVKLEEKPEINWLIAIVGAIGGSVVALVLICAITLFDGKLQTEGEINKRLGISRLLMISSNVKDSIDEKKIEAMSIRVKNMIEQESNKDVCLIGSTNVLNSDKVHKICDILLKQDISCKIVDGLLTQEDAMNEVMKRNIVLVEELGKSKVKDIYMIANICNDMDANVIGYICIGN